MVGEDRSGTEVEVHRAGAKIQGRVHEGSSVVQVVQDEYKVSTVCPSLFEGVFCWHNIVCDRIRQEKRFTDRCSSVNGCQSSGPSVHPVSSDFDQCGKN